MLAHIGDRYGWLGLRRRWEVLRARVTRTPPHTLTAILPVRGLPTVPSWGETDAISTKYLLNPPVWDLTDVIDSFNCNGLRAGKVVLWASDEDDDGVKSYITWSIGIYDDEGWTISGINGGRNAEQLWDGVATTDGDVKAVASKFAEAIRIASED